MLDPASALPLGHDGYLKAWALDGPLLDTAVMYLDEAQDTNPVVFGVVRRQAAQIVLVGDTHQQIYAWRGAVDAMDRFEGCRAYLTQSFRFGPEIARATTAVLRTLGETRPIVGDARIASRVVADGRPRAILARTNVGVMEALASAQRSDHRVHLIGKGDLISLLRDVQALQAGRPVGAGDLAGFRRWGRSRLDRAPTMGAGCAPSSS